MSSVVKKTASAPQSIRQCAQEGMASATSASDRGVPTSPSVDSVDPDNAGARLDCLSLSNDSLGNTPLPRAIVVQSTAAKMVHASASDGSLNFQLGKKPSGDVFLSPIKAVQERQQDAIVTTPTRGVGMTLNTPKDGQDLEGSPARPLRTRASNLSGRHFVGGVDAQGVYPPSACVFVANLPEPKDDQALEAAVTREFSKYGTVFVKIRRDLHHMPFAFCQYTKDEEAKLALEQGKGTMILGRACRTEMVKANRTYVVYKRRRTHITTDEVHDLLSPYGALNQCEVLHPQLRDMMGYPLAIVVEFAMFDATRDLQSAFRHDEEYKVEPFDYKRSLAMVRTNPDEAFLKQYEIDRRSVFVGGLPQEITETEIRGLFEEVGKVLSVQLIKKPTSSGTRTFAFIEYERPDMPEVAITTFHDRMVHDVRIRVERKVAKDHMHTPRRARSQLLGGYRSPAVAAKPAGTPPTSVGREPVVREPVGREPVSPAHQEQPAQPNPVPASGPQSWSWMYGMQPWAGSAYGYGSTGPYSAQANNNGVAVTPQATPGSVNPYAYYGGFWPGMSYVQDPAAMAYYGYTTPTPASGARPGAEDDRVTTPTRPSPAAGRGDGQHP